MAQQILDWVEEGSREVFTARECYRDLHLRAETAKVALALLEELGWVRQVSGEFGRGGKPTPRFRVNPVVTLGDTAVTQPSEDPPAEQCHSCVTDTAPVSGEENPQVDPPDDTESNGSSVLRHRVTSGHRYLSEDSLYLLENERKSEPPDTRDTGDTASSQDPAPPPDPEPRPDEM
jgi:hypothetical protein